MVDGLATQDFTIPSVDPAPALGVSEGAGFTPAPTPLLEPAQQLPEFDPTALPEEVPLATEAPVLQEDPAALPETPLPDTDITSTAALAPSIDDPIETLPPDAIDIADTDAVTPDAFQLTDLAATGRRAAYNEMEDLLHFNAIASATPKTTRPLHRRATVDEHFNMSINNEMPGQDSLVTVSAVGGIANGKTVGRSKPTSFRANARKVDATVNDVANYAKRYPHLSQTEQSAGAIDLFYRNVNRYLPAATIPGQQTIGEITQSFNLYAQWDRLSNPTRFRRTANQLISSAKDLGFKDQIPAQAISGISLMNFGFSAYQLLENWDAMSNEQRAVASINAINSGAQAYTAGSALVSGANGATATGGATAAEAGGLTFGGALAYAGGIIGAYTLIDGWGTGGAAGRTNGAASGAAIGASVYGPIGAAVGAVIGLAVGSINTGKSAEQQKRDAYRSHYEKNKVFEKQGSTHVIQLSDGNFYNVGTDGSSGRAEYAGATKTFANPDRLNNLGDTVGDNELRPYDIDYTNDLDFLTSWATKGLNVVMNGGSHIEGKTSAESRQMNGYLVNAATANAGRELNETNFSAVMKNVRQFYSKIGLNTKEQAMAAINQLRQMGRITTEDMDSLLYGIEFAFSDNFATASNLMAQLRAQDEVRNA